jgi:hypothetical protein
MEFYVYLHKRVIDDVVFYVGKGRIYPRCKYARANDKSTRHKDWKEYIAKYEYKVEIYKTFNSDLDAIDYENKLINHYGFLHNNTGTLVNKMISTVKTYQYDTNGNFIAEYDSIRSAARNTGTHFGDLQDNIKGKLNQANNFQWRDFKKDKIGMCVKNKRIKGQFPIYQLDEQCNIIKEWISLEDIKRELNINKGLIYRSYKNKDILIGGYKWIKKINYGNTYNKKS